MIKNIIIAYFLSCSLQAMHGGPHYQHLALAVMSNDAVEAVIALKGMTLSTGKLDEKNIPVCTELFFEAVKNSKFAVVLVFLRYGIDINVQDAKTWNTALHFAVIHSDVRMFWLLAQDARIRFDICDINHKTAYDLAMDLKDELKIRFLEAVMLAHRSGRPMTFEDFILGKDAILRSRL